MLRTFRHEDPGMFTKPVTLSYDKFQESLKPVWTLRMDAPHVRFFDSDFYLCGAAPPLPTTTTTTGAELPHRYLPGPSGQVTELVTVKMFIPFLAFHTPTKAYIAEDYGPRHLTTLDGTKGGGTTGTKVERIAGQVGPLVDHARSNIKSNDVHGVTIVCLVDIFDKIPRSRLNDESSRMVAHFRTTWYRKVEECSAVSLCGNQILWSLQFESFRR